MGASAALLLWLGLRHRPLRLPLWSAYVLVAAVAAVPLMIATKAGQ
jgi:hypothetical protein